MAVQPIIPFFGVKRQYQFLREELLDITDRVYSTGQVLDGAYTEQFEREIAIMCNRTYAVAVNSCTQGLINGLSTCVPRESKILIPTLSFAATLNSVLLVGHEPVFCDTDGQGLIDLESLDTALDGAGITAIMYPNLWGHTIDYDRFRIQTEFFADDIFIIEDAAQSFGAWYKDTPSGKLGDISVLSFDPTKNLNNYGSGGMILTDDQYIYQALVNYRDNGKESGHDQLGTNSKMSESDCAQMLIKLKYFDSWQERRTKIADYYIDKLMHYVDIVLPGEDVESAWSKFVMRVNERHGLKHHLALKGIETKFHYDKPLFELPAGYNYVDYARQLFRESTAFSRECLSLPIYPELTDAEVETIAESVIEYLR